MRRIKTKVKQHAPQSILFRVQTVHVCVVILQFFIVYCIYSSCVKQILSVIAYKIRVFQQYIFTEKKVDKKPHNHRNKCSLAGGGVHTNKVFPLFTCKIGIDFRMQLCCTNTKCSERLWPALYCANKSKINMGKGIADKKKQKELSMISNVCRCKYKHKIKIMMVVLSLVLLLCWFYDDVWVCACVKEKRKNVQKKNEIRTRLRSHIACDKWW